MNRYWQIPRLSGRRSGVVAAVAVSAITILLTAYLSFFGFHFPIYHDDGIWIRVKTDDKHLSPSMVLALRDSPAAVSVKSSGDSRKLW
jgi:hypothetical protein